jgi:anti-sigma factor RsiW
MEFEHHPSDDQLEEYARGKLPEEEAELLEQHLLICPRCQDSLAEIDAFIDATRQAAAKLQMEPVGGMEDNLRGIGRWVWRPVPLITASVLFVLLGAAYFGRWPTRPGAPEFPVSLQAVRGGEGLASARAPARSPLQLRLDLAGLPSLDSYRLEVVDQHGTVAYQAVVKQGLLRVPPKLPEGRYWVRIYEPAPHRTLLREFGLQLD